MTSVGLSLFNYPFFLEGNSYFVIQYRFHVIGNVVADVVRKYCAFYIISVFAVMLFIRLWISVEQVIKATFLHK